MNDYQKIGLNRRVIPFIKRGATHVDIMKTIYVVIVNSKTNGFVKVDVATSEQASFVLGETMINTLVKMDDCEQSDLCYLVEKFVV